ncbi:MAG: YaiI/YqxD family protein [Pseudomonadota bacterium]
MPAADSKTADDIRIFVDADACPVKDEVFRVAGRHGLHVFVVANSYMRLPSAPLIERVLVEDGPDVADDWIADHARARDIVITADIPLADRALSAGAAVIAPDGKLLTQENIGMRLATRNLMADIRAATHTQTHNPAFTARDRSAFLQTLENTVQRLSRELPR